MEALKIDGTVEMSHQEMENTEGGVAPIVVAAGICAAGVGVIIVGAVVGYCIYRLIDWATR